MRALVFAGLSSVRSSSSSLSVVARRPAPPRHAVGAPRRRDRGQRHPGAVLPGAHPHRAPGRPRDLRPLGRRRDHRRPARSPGARRPRRSRPHRDAGGDSLGALPEARTAHDRAVRRRRSTRWTSASTPTPTGNLDLAERLRPEPAEPAARSERARACASTSRASRWSTPGRTGRWPARRRSTSISTDFRGALTYAPDFLEGDISDAKITARRIANGADVVGSLVAHVQEAIGRQRSIRTATSDVGRHRRGDRTVDPRVARRRQGRRGGRRADDRAGDIRALWPASPIESRPQRARRRRTGPSPTSTSRLHAGVGDAAFDAKGTASLGDEKTAKVTLQAQDIDAHEFAASAPRRAWG